MAADPPRETERAPKAGSAQRAPALTAPGNPDEAFTQNLLAAIQFKNFLVGRGVDVPPEVLKGLGDLASAFQAELSDHRSREANASDSRKTVTHG